MERLSSPSGQRLQMPGAAEQLALADVRTYSLVAKVHVPGQPRRHEETREVRVETAALTRLTARKRFRARPFSNLSRTPHHRTTTRKQLDP